MFRPRGRFTSWLAVTHGSFGPPKVRAVGAGPSLRCPLPQPPPPPVPHPVSGDGGAAESLEGANGAQGTGTPERAEPLSVLVPGCRDTFQLSTAGRAACGPDTSNFLPRFPHLYVVESE